MAEEKPSIWIGKNGITDELVKEVSNKLKRTKTAKIKIQRTALKASYIKDLANAIAEKTDSKIIEIRGHSITLFREQEKQ